MASIENGADPNRYCNENPHTLRSHLSLPTKTRIALYAGHLYDWKGSATLLDAALAITDKDSLTIVVIGGSPYDIERCKKEAHARRLQHIQFLGHKPKADVPKYLVAADVLLLPNSAMNEESVQQTSPIKLFEYLAAGRPIIASDLPSLRAIVTEHEALFVPPDNGTALTHAIRKLLSQPENMSALGHNALALSQKYTWNTHASRLMAFITSLGSP
jgi:glycosyltransferase involved in cell wall biosynthesis